MPRSVLSTNPVLVFLILAGEGGRPNYSDARIIQVAAYFF